MLAKNIGKRRTIMGSVRRATQRPNISVFHDGCRAVVTFVPSVRIILFGSTIKKGIVTPIRVRTRKPIWVHKFTQTQSVKSKAYSRRFRSQLELLGQCCKLNKELRAYRRFPMNCPCQIVCPQSCDSYMHLGMKILTQRHRCTHNST